MSQKIKCIDIIPWTNSVWKGYKKMLSVVYPCRFYISVTRWEATSITEVRDKVSTVRGTEMKGHILSVQRTESWSPCLYHSKNRDKKEQEGFWDSQMTMTCSKSMRHLLSPYKRNINTFLLIIFHCYLLFKIKIYLNIFKTLQAFSNSFYTWGSINILSWALADNLKINICEDFWADLLLRSTNIKVLSKMADLQLCTKAELCF